MLYVFVVFIVASPFTTIASEITIRPFLIHETLEPRESVTNLVVINSEYETRKAIVYATVNEISVGIDGEIKEFISPVMTDRTNTVTSWIEITRGRIEIPAGESREIPLTIRLHPQAKPGEYHVFVGLVEAKNRPAARSIAMKGDADGVVVKVTVPDQRSDNLKISSFSVQRFVTGDKNRDVEIELENVGDLPTAPEGEIIFYDSRGNEVSSVLLAGDSIDPGSVGVIKTEIPPTNGLGKFKANLSLNYGANQAASLFDTTFFYLMPLHWMIALFLGVLVISVLTVLLMKKAFGGDSDGDNYEDSFSEVTMYVKDGHSPDPKDHDINLKNEL